MKIVNALFVVLTVLVMVSGNASGQLNGDYTVGSGILDDYPDLPTAIATLNSSGVNGPVRFLLTDASYTLTASLQIDIGTSPPTSTNTVTIKPSSGVSPTISGSIAGTASNGLIEINGTNYVTIDGSNTDGGSSRNLTIQNTNTGALSTIMLGYDGANPTTNITIKNCNILCGTVGDASTGNAAIFANSTSGNPANPARFSNISITNNSIGNTSYGVFLNGEAGNAGPNVNVQSNILGGSNQILIAGVMMIGVGGGLVSGNSISNFVTSEPVVSAGVRLEAGTNNVTVAGNTIQNLHYTGSGGFGAMGIMVSTGISGAGISIVNNMISDISGDGDDISSLIQYCPHGIYAGPTFDGSGGSQSGITIYHNTVHLFGNTLGYAGAYSVGITLGTGTSATIKNNIIVNKLGTGGGGVGAVGVYAQSSSSQFSSINFNNYYCAASPGSNSVGKIGGSDYGTLAAFQTATSQDGNSASTSVSFVSNTDLRLTGLSIGDPLLTGTGVGVGTDIEGDARDATNPYMGADEADTPLPITLAEFVATIESGTHHVRLDWATLSEVNNFGFIVQRRQGDDETFVDLPGSFVKGSGTTAEPQRYTYLDVSVTPGIWYYRLKQVDLDGAVHFSDPVQVGVVTGVEEQVPMEYALAQNYPNPFNPSTTISYELPRTSQVRLELYDALGQLVGTLVDKEQGSGRYMVQLQADHLSAGVYFYRLQAGDFVASKKLLLVK